MRARHVPVPRRRIPKRDQRDAILVNRDDSVRGVEVLREPDDPAGTERQGVDRALDDERAVRMRVFVGPGEQVPPSKEVRALVEPHQMGSDLGEGGGTWCDGRPQARSQDRGPDDGGGRSPDDRGLHEGPSRGRLRLLLHGPLDNLVDSA